MATSPPWAVLLAFLVSACAAPVPTEADVGPADPAAQMRPDLLLVDPVVARPGDIVALRFPEETSRGILFVLEERVGATWAHRFNLTSDGPGAGWQRSWARPGEEGFAVADIGVGGPGPDRVTIPEPATAGEYRICTGNAGDEFCAPIEIRVP